MDSTQQQNIMTSSETAMTSPFYFESDQSGLKPHESATPNVVSRNFCPCCDVSSTSTSQDTGYCGYYEKELEDRLETDHRSSDCHCSPSGAQDCDATCRLEYRSRMDSMEGACSSTTSLLLSDDEFPGNQRIWVEGDPSVDIRNRQTTFNFSREIFINNNSRWRSVIEP